MVAVVPQRIHLWLLSVIGILIFITFTCSDASSMVNSLDKVQVVNGSSAGLSSELKNQSSNGNATTLLARLEKTSFKCEGKPRRLCERDSRRRHNKQVAKLKPDNSSRSFRSNSEEKVASQSRQLQRDRMSSNKIRKRSSNNHSYKYSNISNSDYLPVHYGPYGYQDDVSEARGWITVPLFIIFSIIQFKLVSAIFLAFFGPMILFLLIVQGFLFKATLVLLGLMMS